MSVMSSEEFAANHCDACPSCKTLGDLKYDDKPVFVDYPDKASEITAIQNCLTCGYVFKIVYTFSHLAK